MEIHCQISDENQRLKDEIEALRSVHARNASDVYAIRATLSPADGESIIDAVVRLRTAADDAVKGNRYLRNEVSRITRQKQQGMAEIEDLEDALKIVERELANAKDAAFATEGLQRDSKAYKEMCLWYDEVELAVFGTTGDAFDDDLLREIQALASFKKRVVDAL